MKISVKLYGTVRKLVPAYDAARGLTLEVPDHTTAADLIVRLGLLGSNVGPVSVNHQIVQRDAVIPQGARVKIFQRVFGG